MKTRIVPVGPLRPTISGFLGLLAIVAAVAAAKGAKVIDPDVARRAIGILIGMMIVLVGNFIPKIRPLNSASGDPRKHLAAERFGGWILVLTGVAYTALFVFAPLEEAQRVSSIGAIGAIVVLAASWIWLTRDMLTRSDQGGAEHVTLGSDELERRNTAIWLLFGLFYVIAAACSVFLARGRNRELATWIVLWLGIVYAVLFGVLERRRSC